MVRDCYIVEYFKVGFGGRVEAYGKVWTAWPWCRWVKVWHYIDSYGHPVHFVAKEML